MLIVLFRRLFVIHKQQTMSHHQLNYVAELLNKGTCLFRPGRLQTGAITWGTRGSVSK